MYGPPDIDHLKELKTKADGGADFAGLARDNSEAPSAASGGDIGWVAKGQLDQKLTDAIFAAQVGKTSEAVDRSHRRRLPLQGPRRGNPYARGPPARDDQEHGLLQLVPGTQVRG